MLALSSMNQIDITERGREVSLSRWILRRVRLETVRVVKQALPSGPRAVDGSKDSCRKKTASWERVSEEHHSHYDIKSPVKAYVFSRKVCREQTWYIIF